MAHRIRSSAMPAPLRLVLYGLLGLSFEVAAFPIVRLARMIPVVKYLFAFDNRPDPSLALDGIWEAPWVTLYGQTSLWMVPIYAFSALCIELLYRKVLPGKTWMSMVMIRAPVYGVVILVIELFTGLLVKALTGYAIWMYHDQGSIWHMTSIYILPVWMFVGLAVELLYRKLMELQVRPELEDVSDST